jgi:hypothetical protein
MATTRLLQGGMEPVSQYPLATGYTPVDGDWVVLDADGEVAAATASSTVLLGRAKPSYDDGYVLVVKAMPNVQFLMRADDTVAQTMVGDTFDLVVANTGEFLVDVGASSLDVIRIDEILDATAKLVYVSVPAAKSQAV